MTSAFVMARRADSSDYRAMKHVIAIVLLCLPTQLSAAERCNASRHNRDEIVREASPKPPAIRADPVRPNKVRARAPWQRVLIFEPQIL